MSETPQPEPEHHETPQPEPEQPETPQPEPAHPAPAQPERVQADVVQVGSPSADGPDEAAEESVTSPAKVMRIGSMVKQLLEEVRGAPLDEASRERLAEIYDRSITELSAALSPDLSQELHTLALPFDDGEIPSESELRVAKAQLVGWLEGLFHGIQATLMAQQFAARQQLQEMRQLPGGMPNQPGQAESGAERPGTYL